MASVESWKKRIIEKFIERSHRSSYCIEDPQQILYSFGNIEFAGNTAWEELLEEEILVSRTINSRSVIHLNPNKHLEIRNYYNTEPVEEIMAKLQPPPSTFEGLEQRDSIVTENAWPRQGTYYLCTLIEDPTSWVALYRSKPNRGTTRMNFGSLQDKNSKIISMWNTIHGLGKRESIFYKKQAEDENQQAFGNNRQPATASFNIFCYLGWIKEAERRGKRVFYTLSDARLYYELVNNQAYVCRGCSKIYRERYCDECGSPI